MKRSRTASIGLKHLAFFEAVGEAEENSAAAYSATAGLLMLRLIDHWILAGPVMVEPESVSVRSVRNAIMQLPAREPMREVLLGMVNAMQTVREVDVMPVLPRLFAYAGCLEKTYDLKLAADVYGTIARLGEEDFDGDLMIDSYLRLGYCQRNLGSLNEAETAYTTAGKMAKRQRETERELRSRIGIAVVIFNRGNLPKADELLLQVAAESSAKNCVEVTSKALHVRSLVALRRNDLGRSASLAYQAFRLTEIAQERDMILGDIAAAFVVMKRFSAARDALMILDATGITEVVRLNARVNMVALAARSGDRDLFSSARSRVDCEMLTPETQVNYLIESARGFRLFDERERAHEMLLRARELAIDHEFNRSIFEVEEMLAERAAVAESTSGETRFEDSDSAADVELEIRKMALAVA